MTVLRAALLPALLLALISCAPLPALDTSTVDWGTVDGGTADWGAANQGRAAKTAAGSGSAGFSVGQGAALPLSSRRPAVTGSLPRVPGSPDVLIFGISGRCGPPCQAPQDDWDYLSERGTLRAIANVFEARGLSTEVHGYAERVAGPFRSRRSPLPQQGVLTLLADYGRLSAEWVVGRRGTRIILVGHSHGSVWGHYLSALYPQVPVATLIDLDTNCVAWGADHAAELRAAVQAGESRLDAGSTDLLRSPLRACNNVLAGSRRANLKDVVLPNVALNLEVQSKRWPARPIPGALSLPGTNHGGLYFNYLFDLTPNRRPSGAQTDIATFVSVREDHSAVSYPNSTAVQWVRDQLSLLPWLPPLPVKP
jgi:hypothetical protein